MRVGRDYAAHEWIEFFPGVIGLEWAVAPGANGSGESWTLVRKDGSAAPVDDTYTDFRGDRWVLDGGRPPHKPGSTGRVYVTAVPDDEEA
jgi:hypothetical protein